jgi:hypothetical protein
VYKVEIGPKLAEDHLRDRFSEHIGDLICRCDKTNVKGSEGNFLADKMKIDLDMFGAGMKYGIGGQICGAKVVAPQHPRTRLTNTKFLEDA